MAGSSFYHRGSRIAATYLSRLRALTTTAFVPELGFPILPEAFMQMLNPHCGIDRDSRGVVHLTICKAGPLNILGSEAIKAVREGLEALAPERGIRALILAGESQKSMIGGADIKEMARLDQKSAETFITGLRDLCEAVRRFPAPVIARLPGWCLGGGLEVAVASAFPA
jgi:enoyl-CoA hydratase